MKIQFQKQHDSIKSFDPISFGEFSVITGKNGTGKTHFLKGIQEGNFNALSGNRHITHIAYFDYNEFTVKAATNNGQPVAHQQIPKKQDKKAFNHELNKIKSNLEMLFVEQVLQTKDFVAVEEVEVEAKRRYQYDFFRQQFINNNIYLFEPSEWISIDIAIQNSGIEDYDRELWQEFHGSLKNLVIAFYEDNDCNRLYEVTKQKGVAFLNIHASYFNYTESFLGSQLENVFKQHRQNQESFKLNLLDRMESGEKLDLNDELKLHNKDHKAPWEFLNEILNEYKLNNFYFDETDIPVYPRHGGAFNINLYLRKRETNQKVSIESLSSGEKTPFALAINIFQETKNGDLPELLLLDEVDASLHPSMCKQLIHVLKKVFVRRGIKVIVVTHSPSTIAHTYDGDIYVMDKAEEKHIIQLETKHEALKILTDGFIGIATEDTQLEIDASIEQTPLPVLFTEGITDKIILKQAYKKLYPEKNLPFHIEQAYDAKMLGTMFKRGGDSQHGIFTQHPNKIFFSLFDFDEAVPPNSIQGQVISPDGEHFGGKSNLQIELLLYGVESISSKFKEKAHPGGSIIEFAGNKNKFTRDVVPNLNCEDFKNFKPLFEKIEEIISEAST